ncbi:MAG: SPOR domain-containing protein [Sphingomonas sp.]
MIPSAFLRRAAIALATAATSLSPALAQTEIVAAPNPDADMLAGEMRVLAADPRDLRALLAAGELSGRLGDTAAALAFFARAEAIDPENARLFAGRATVLLKLERPGEALRLFADAEARGLPVREYAADRALAYDLLGAPQLAQKDYKAAMAWRPQDETARRYALSLGITGKQQEAMALLDPLLRKSDRAAWRARAFILAMNGDIPGAERIAASMMPGSMGNGLTPFFRRLETLSVADRAYAVHFGELRPTRARVADAALAPALPAYVPDPVPAPVAVAAAPPPPAAAASPDRGPPLAPPARARAACRDGLAPCAGTHAGRRGRAAAAAAARLSRGARSDARSASADDPGACRRRPDAAAARGRAGAHRRQARAAQRPQAAGSRARRPGGCGACRDHRQDRDPRGGAQGDGGARSGADPGPGARRRRTGQARRQARRQGQEAARQARSRQARA